MVNRTPLFPLQYFLIILCSGLVHPLTSGGFNLDAIEGIFDSRIRSGSDIHRSLDPSVITVAFILTNVQVTVDSKEASLERHLDKMITSLLSHSDRSSSIHMVVLTEEDSVGTIMDWISKTIGRYLSLGILFLQSTEKYDAGFPGLQIQFVNVSEIFENHREQIDDMVGLFTTAGTTILMPGDPKRDAFMDEGEFAEQAFEVQVTSKYDNDLYFLAPFYHLSFPLLDSLIIIDIDVEFRQIVIFRSDIKDLAKLFDQFRDSQMIGIANDLTPHYWKSTEDYRKRNPTTSVGAAGLFQEKYAIVGYCAEQFNLQTSEFMRSLSPSKEHWDQYHRCSGEPKIVHNNGAIGEHDPDHVDDMMHEEALS